MRKNLFGRILSFFADPRSGVVKKADSPDKDGEYEVCVLCGNLTDVKIQTPIEERTGFVSGCGQMCGSCFEKAKLTGSFGCSPEQLADLRNMCGCDDLKTE